MGLYVVKKTNPDPMLKSLLSTAITNLVKDRTSSAVNILVITCFITFALIILLNILYDSSFDKYHEKGEKIYRIVSTVKDGDSRYLWNVSQASLAPELLKRYPEVRNAVRFFPLGSSVFFAAGREFPEDAFYAADPAVFTVFTFEMLAGHCRSALAQPNSMVVTESVAKRFYGGVARAMHQPITNNKGQVFQITGVIKDVPSNSHFTFDGLISALGSPAPEGGWANFSTHTYIELPDNYNARRMCGHLNNLADEKLRDIARELDVHIGYQMQKLTEIHKAGQVVGRSGGHFRWDQALLIVSCGVIFIVGFLLMMRHSQEKIATRSQGEEVAKAMGNKRATLIVHLIAESVCITIIAFFLGAGLVYAILPLFNELMNKEIPFHMIWDSSVALMMVAVFVFSGFVGAIYPSFYLPRYSESIKFDRAQVKKEEIYLV